MEPALTVGLLWLLFGGLHIGLATRRPRASLVAPRRAGLHDALLAHRRGDVRRGRPLLCEPPPRRGAWPGARRCGRAPLAPHGDDRLRDRAGARVARLV